MKLLTGPLTQRITEVLTRHGVVSDWQQGALPGSSTGPPLFMAQQQLQRGEPNYVSSFNVRKALDTSPHGALHLILRHLSVPPEVIDLLIFLHTCTRLRIVTAHGLTQPVHMLRGVREGNPESPLLYALFLEPLLRAQGHRLRPPGGAEQGPIQADIDDLLVVAHTLQHFVEGVEAVAADLGMMGMELNPRKCAMATTEGVPAADPPSAHQPSPPPPAGQRRAATARRAGGPSEDLHGGLAPVGRRGAGEGCASPVGGRLPGTGTTGPHSRGRQGAAPGNQGGTEGNPPSTPTVPPLSAPPPPRPQAAGGRPEGRRPRTPPERAAAPRGGRHSIGERSRPPSAPSQPPTHSRITRCQLAALRRRCGPRQNGGTEECADEAARLGAHPGKAGGGRPRQRELPPPLPHCPAGGRPSRTQRPRLPGNPGRMCIPRGVPRGTRTRAMDHPPG